MKVVARGLIHGVKSSSRESLDKCSQPQPPGRTVPKVNNGMFESPSPRQVEQKLDD